MPTGIPRFPGRKIYRAELEKRYGRSRAALLMQRAEEHWRALYPGRPRLNHPAMQKNHLEHSVLPAIAVYRSLLEDHTPPAVALQTLSAALAETVRGRRRLTAWLAKFPFFFTVFRWMTRMGFPLIYPPEGFSTTWVEDSPRRLAFLVHTCIFHSLLMRYGLPELTAAFCDTDELYRTVLPPDVTWTRAQTLGHGGDCCDFCYERGAAGAAPGREAAPS